MRDHQSSRTAIHGGAGGRAAARSPITSDQLFVDLNLGQANIPPGTRLAIGGAVIEITRPAHTGCAKFSARFGLDALKCVNSPDGRVLGLRGVNARVVQPGIIRTGDAVRKPA